MDLLNTALEFVAGLRPNFGSEGSQSSVGAQQSPLLETNIDTSREASPGTQPSGADGAVSDDTGANTPAKETSVNPTFNDEDEDGATPQEPDVEPTTTTTTTPTPASTTISKTRSEEQPQQLSGEQRDPIGAASSSQAITTPVRTEEQPESSKAG